MTEYILGILRALSGQRGQALAEYTLILAFVFVACILAVGALGLVLSGQLDAVTAALP